MRATQQAAVPQPLHPPFLHPPPKCPSLDCLPRSSTAQLVVKPAGAYPVFVFSSPAVHTMHTSQKGKTTNSFVLLVVWRIRASTYPLPRSSISRHHAALALMDNLRQRRHGKENAHHYPCNEPLVRCSLALPGAQRIPPPPPPPGITHGAPASQARLYGNDDDDDAQ